MKTRAHNAKAFSLTELLVVVGVIMILAAMLVTVGNQAWVSAQAVACQQNLEQIAQACQMYKNETRLEVIWGIPGGPAGSRWPDQIRKYLPLGSGPAHSDPGYVLACPLLAGAGGVASSSGGTQEGDWITPPGRLNATRPILIRPWVPSTKQDTYMQFFYDIMVDHCDNQVQIEFGKGTNGDPGDNLTIEHLEGYGQVWIGDTENWWDNGFTSNYDSIKKFREVYGGGIHLAPGNTEMVNDISERAGLGMEVIRGKTYFVGGQYRYPGSIIPWHWAYDHDLSSVRGVVCEAAYKPVFYQDITPASYPFKTTVYSGYENIIQAYTNRSNASAQPDQNKVNPRPDWGTQGQYVHMSLTWAPYFYPGGVIVYDPNTPPDQVQNSYWPQFRPATQAEWDSPNPSWTAAGFGRPPAYLTISHRDGAGNLLPPPSQPWTNFPNWGWVGHMNPFWIMNYNDIPGSSQNAEGTNWHPGRLDVTSQALIGLLHPPDGSGEYEGGRVAVENSNERYNAYTLEYYPVSDGPRTAINIARWLGGGKGTGEREQIPVVEENIVTYGYNILVCTDSEGHRTPDPINPRETIRCLDYITFTAHQHTDDIAEGEEGDGDDPADSILCVHGGKANVLFMDGHVELLTREEILSTSPERWRPSAN